MRRSLPLLALALFACNYSDKQPDGDPVTSTDTRTGSPGTGTGSATGTGSGTGTGTGTGGTAPVADCAELTGPGALQGSTAYATVQEAVDAAADGSGVVWLCPGTYTEAITVTADTWIGGVGGADAVTLQGDGTSSVIAVSGAAITLVGLTLTGGDDTYGGGLAAASATSVTLEDCRFTGNDATYGGGAHVGGTVTLTRTEFVGNAADEYGGGLAIDDDAVVSATDVVVDGNSAQLGGGVFGFPGASLDGGGSTVVRGNTADNGAGLYVWNGTLSNLTVENNSATSTGGGLVAYEGATLTDVDVLGNEAALGGGINADDGPLGLTRVLVDGNAATSQGGGLHVDNLTLTADQLTVSNNTSVEFGGGAFGRDITWDGGTLSNNVAATGGGLYLSNSSLYDLVSNLAVDGNTATESGGGLASLSADATFTDVDVTTNHSDIRGGGIYVSNGGLFTFRAGSSATNSATEYGGGAYFNTGSVGALFDTPVDANQAQRGAGLYINGGSTVTANDGSIVSNGDPTTISGGGVRIEDGGLTTVNTDFGAGPDDNEPDDIFCVNGPASYADYDAGVSVVCTEISCL